MKTAGAGCDRGRALDMILVATNGKVHGFVENFACPSVISIGLNRKCEASSLWKIEPQHLAGDTASDSQRSVHDLAVHTHTWTLQMYFDVVNREIARRSGGSNGRGR